MNWLIHGVSPTLAFIQEVDNYFDSNLINEIINCGELSSRQQKNLENLIAEPDYYREEVAFYTQYLQNMKKEKIHKKSKAQLTH